MSYLNWLQVNEERSRSIQGLLTDIQMGTARAVSDGSYKSEFDTGTAAYRIESQDSYQYVQGTSISPGTCEQQNAYQSEIVGLLAILDTLTSICTEHNLSHGRLTIGCDGISALKSARNCTINSVNPKQKHSDILSAIAKLKDKLSIDLDFIHVKGHQDDLQDYADLDRLGQLNVMMDIEAKELLKVVTTTEQGTIEVNKFIPHPQSFTLAKVMGNTIWDQISHNIYRAITDKIIINHWIDRKRFKEEDKDLIDWKNHEKAMKLVGLSRRQFVTKWGNNFVATGKNMKRWKLRAHGSCPFCEAEEEDTNHILTCLHEEAKETSKEALWVLLETMIKIGTCSRLVMALKIELLEWRNQRVPTDIEMLDEELQEVIRSQRKLG